MAKEVLKKKWAAKIYLTNEPALCSRLVKGFKILLQQLCLVFFCEHLNQEQEQEQEQEQRRSKSSSRSRSRSRSRILTMLGCM